MAAHGYGCAAHATARACKADTANYCAYASSACDVAPAKFLAKVHFKDTLTVECGFLVDSDAWCGLDATICPAAVCSSVDSRCALDASKTSNYALFVVGSGEKSWTSTAYGTALSKLYNGCDAMKTAADWATAPPRWLHWTPSKVLAAVKGLQGTTITTSNNGTNVNITGADGTYTTTTAPDGTTTVTYPNGTYTYCPNGSYVFVDKSDGSTTRGSGTVGNGTSSVSVTTQDGTMTATGNDATGKYTYTTGDGM